MECILSSFLLSISFLAYSVRIQRTQKVAIHADDKYVPIC